MLLTASVSRGHAMVDNSWCRRRMTMKRLVLALSALSLIAGSVPALAAPCKDKKGRFIKSPAKPTVCRNAKGHFTKCK
jgi:hypothetical protein